MGGGASGHSFTHLCMSSGNRRSPFPPMSSHWSAGSATTQSGTAGKSFMDRSRCCSFFRFLNCRFRELTLRSAGSKWVHRTPVPWDRNGRYLVWKLVQVPVHGQLQSLQTLTAAQLFRNKLDSVAAEQELSELRQLP